MAGRFLARLWFWLTEDRPPRHRPPPYPKGDPPRTYPVERVEDELERARQRREKNWGDAVSRARDNRENGLDWPDD